MGRTVQYLCFCDWLVLLCRRFSGFIHVVENDRISFFFNLFYFCIAVQVQLSPFFKAECYFIVRTLVYHIFFIYSTVSRHLNCFHALVAVNKAAVKMGVQMCLQDPDYSSSGHPPRSGIAG